jgi:hypothetical protein
MQIDKKKEAEFNNLSYFSMQSICYKMPVDHFNSYGSIDCPMLLSSHAFNGQLAKNCLWQQTIADIIFSLFLLHKFLL